MPLCYEHTLKEMLRLYKREGGLKSYAGTSDAREIEKRVLAGDKELEVVYDGYIYQIAKGIGSLATVTNGAVDRIALTGGVAYSEMVVSELKKSWFYRTDPRRSGRTRDDCFIKRSRTSSPRGRRTKTI